MGEEAHTAAQEPSVSASGLERELDAGCDQLAEALERLTEHNMREYYDSFTAALAADALLPEDF